GVDFLRRSHTSGVRPSPGGGNQRRRPGLERGCSRRVEDHKSARRTHRHLRSPDLEAVIRLARLCHLVLALLSVVRHVTLLVRTERSATSPWLRGRVAFPCSLLPSARRDAAVWSCSCRRRPGSAS